ncbi:hypothetical protein XX58_001351 [Salmonella enterica subsp. salamae]|uniref:Uncharacterized protein n=2 Tax=Salmonella enterica TaxID=28901 RepID=A0A603KVN5_SALER|nr:hypothetical protein [Salmonella enterica]EAA6224953.1 hypothetical protein [Salmonella enterica subsp. salamae]EBP3807878.1 hypothetical protein [Salmonella enterica subsp. enterica]EAA6248536.1 hypothetical protein [Salmonella enterica subsp. salamae]EAM3922562.1 hypothetical protein [Salmonella enterica]EAN9128381.1 hypothetical protein [Salmonella enterica]
MLCSDRARRHFSYRHGMVPGPRKGADMLFPQYEAAFAGAVPGRQWPEENNLMTQEYAGMSTGRVRTGKCRYSTGAKIFLLLLAVSTVAALSGLYRVLTY